MNIDIVSKFFMLTLSSLQLIHMDSYMKCFSARQSLFIYHFIIGILTYLILFLEKNQQIRYIT